MTTYNQWQRIKELSLLKEECRRQGLTLHATKAGLICRKEGRIVKHAFSTDALKKQLSQGDMPKTVYLFTGLEDTISPVLQRVVLERYQAIACKVNRKDPGERRRAISFIVAPLVNGHSKAIVRTVRDKVTEYLEQDYAG